MTVYQPSLRAQRSNPWCRKESLDCFAALAMTGRERGNTMIDHVSVGVADLERAARFYEATLAPLGLMRLVTRPATIGFGKTYPEFWINLRAGMASVPPESGTHICLRAKATGEVDAFHAAALTARGRSHGAPGLRPHDRVKYYAAFVVDLDGNRIEAVTFPGDDA